MSEKIEAQRIKNAQLVFMRMLRGLGSHQPDKKYRFLDPSYAKRLVCEAIELDRAKQSASETVVKSTEDAKVKARAWLLRHPGEILCFIGEAGVLSGDSSDYEVDLDRLQILTIHFLRFMTPEHGAMFSILTNEDGHFVSEWGLGTPTS